MGRGRNQYQLQDRLLRMLYSFWTASLQICSLLIGSQLLVSASEVQIYNFLFGRFNQLSEITRSFPIKLKKFAAPVIAYTLPRVLRLCPVKNLEVFLLARYMDFQLYCHIKFCCLTNFVMYSSGTKSDSTKIFTFFFMGLLFSVQFFHFHVLPRIYKNNLFLISWYN